MGIFNLFSSKKNESTDVFNLNACNFVMKVEEVVYVAGRGTIAIGTIDIGIINLSDEVKIVDSSNNTMSTTVVGIEMNKRQLATAREGDRVGLLLKDVIKSDVFPGQHIVK